MPKAPKRALPGVVLVTCCMLLAQGPAFAADANHGKVIAERWCTACHLVAPEQKTPVTDQAPPFASIAKKPDFGPGKLALLLLAPHPNMPKLSLSRSEVADLADYMLTLK